MKPFSAPAAQRFPKSPSRRARAPIQNLDDQHRGRPAHRPGTAQRRLCRFLDDGRETGEAPEKRKLLNLRTFADAQKEAAYAKQGGNCAICGKHFEFAEMQGDHIVPWSKGGKTLPDNLQMLCAKCNQSKGGALL